MNRCFETGLVRWLQKSERKPLILRGARQVGKTWLVRQLAKSAKKELIELNFERDPLAETYFESNDPRKIIDEISLSQNRLIEADKAILFLDELQAAGGIVAKMRWFAEEMPRLPVVAAGSLLEFTLADHSFSMPVGRISFLHIEPMGFFEYLEAHKQSLLLERLKEWQPEQPYPSALHNQALQWFHRYSMTGGMPEVVKADTEGMNAAHSRERQSDLLATYRADFAKYRKRLDTHVLDSVLQAVARSVGEKFVYTKVGAGIKNHQAKQALDMLAAARVCHVVRRSSGNGLPLGAEIKDTFLKIIFNDIGLFHAMLRTPAQNSFPRWERIAPNVRGRMTEQIVGQLIRLQGPFSGDGPALYYWQREGGRPGEVDYLIQSDTQVVPVELKAGAAGSMKSLHQFMYDKKLDFAVRLDGNPPSMQHLHLKTTQGNEVKYRLRSLPWYLAERAECFSLR